MTVSIAAVISLDGKITRHGDPHIEAWASKEDHDHFMRLVDESDCIIMGRGTYEAMGDSLKPEAGKLRVVLTSKAEEFSDRAVPNQLEFMNTSLHELIAGVKETGVQKILIAGGPGIISDVLMGNLADTLYLTIEPRIFGTGTPLVKGELDSHLKLHSSKQLNDNGTMLLTYKID